MLGKLYIIGGEERIGLGCTNVDVVSLDTGEAVRAASMQAPRSFLAIATSASSIFVLGGTQDENVLSSCELFDVQSGW